MPAAPFHPTIVFLSGQTVTMSGMYVIEHNGGHQPNTSRAIPKGMQIPHCPICGTVKVSLSAFAPHISEDPDFSGGSS